MTGQVQTSYGPIKGLVSTDGAVAAFKGIPYAKPPVGPLRWQPPQRLDAWNEIRATTAFGPACIQPFMPPHSLVNGNESATSEDCLTLNVYTGATDRAEKRPVIVWLHHGGFMMGWSGAPLYDGSALARAGAVVVTVNYRLGRLGFLAHPVLSAESSVGASGNYGLMDQIAALEWVRENIAAFGGNPDCVTVYGVSAGAASISVLMASPLAKGLFHRAIGSSGGLFGPVTTSCEGGDCLQTLLDAEALGVQLMSSIGARSADEMRALPPEAILTVKEPLFWLAPRGLLDSTYPIVDGHVLPVSPSQAYAAGVFNDVPLLTGSNAQESSITPFNGDPASFIEDSRAFFGPFFDRFIALFPAKELPHSSAAANSDRLFSWQNWAWARLQASHGSNAVYYYNFVKSPPVPPGTVAEQDLNADVGAFHSAEIPYVWRNLAVRDWPWTDGDRALSETMSGYWLDFARTGNPNGGGRPDWPPFRNGQQALMQFGESATPVAAPSSDRFAFWDEFYAWFNANRAVR